MAKYVIWSHEHKAWWGPDHCGYTEDLTQAGRYTLAEAGAIVVPVIPPGIEIAMDERIAATHGHELIHKGTK